MKIDKVIKQISEADYQSILEKLKANKSEKFLTLFISFRHGIEEEAIFQQLQISDSAFYTLKSRLIDKVQEHLYASISDERMDLLKNVSNVDRLLYKFPKEIAVALLLKMEEDLIENDMQNELTIVYNALKKIFVNTPKYYTYTQKYNKSVAYNLALDKAETIVLEFNKVLGNYFIQPNENDRSILILYKKELTHLSTLYPSHHLSVFKKIVDVQFAIYIKEEMEMLNDDSVEDNLRNLVEIIQSHPNDKVYKYYTNLVNVLYFEYYTKLKLFKNSQVYLERIASFKEDQVYCNRYFFTSGFFISLLDYYNTKEIYEQLYDDVSNFDFNIDPDNFVDNVLYGIMHSFACFYAGQYSKAIYCINELLNKFSFKGVKQCDIEIKLFLALLYIITGKIELSEGLIRSASKKMTEGKDVMNSNLAVFIKILKLLANNRKKELKSKKLEIITEQFYAEMKNTEGYLARLKIHPHHLLSICK